MLVCSNVLGPLKEHVLEQVGESGSAFALIRRPYVIPQIHRYDLIA